MRDRFIFALGVAFAFILGAGTCALAQPTPCPEQCVDVVIDETVIKSMCPECEICEICPPPCAPCPECPACEPCPEPDPRDCCPPPDVRIVPAPTATSIRHSVGVGAGILDLDRQTSPYLTADYTWQFKPRWAARAGVSYGLDDIDVARPHPYYNWRKPRVAHESFKAVEVMIVRSIR